MEKDYPSLKYGEKYVVPFKPFFTPLNGIYIGKDLKGNGRILCRDKKTPVVFCFEVRNTILEGKVLKGEFDRLELNDKEYSFADEILTKKGL